MTLRVIVQIVPKGEEARAKEIGRVEIVNITEPEEIARTGLDEYIVRGHRRTDGFWALLKMVADAACAKEFEDWSRRSAIHVPYGVAVDLVFGPTPLPPMPAADAGLIDPTLAPPKQSSS